MRRHLSCATAAVLALGLSPRAQAVEVSTIYGLQVLGGQYFFGGERGSLTGNVSGVVAPALKFNERWSLLPSLNASYQGTKQVVDLVGAGTLFQEQMDHRAGLRAVYALPESLWRLKPTGSFRYQLLKETKDEDWGKGLFDYYKWSAGFEAEYLYHDPFSFRLGADYFETRFPNYVSLESQAAQTVQGLARELAGDRILDSKNASASLGGSAPVHERLILEGGGLFVYSRFPKQHLVDSTGNLISRVREDLYTSLSAGFKMPIELNSDLRTLGALETALSYNSSSQNSFDAQRTQFIPFYYNYGELRLSPSCKLLIGPGKTPVVLGVSGHWWYRRYPYRLTQDSAGTYLRETIHTSNWMAGASLSYPMAPHFNLLFNVQYGQASSNQRFEQSYRYNYSVTNYLFGFSYDY